MSKANRNGGQPRGRGGDGAKRRRPRQLDLWRPVPQLPPPEPIVPARDAVSTLRSLGDPPLQGQGAVAMHYLGAVVERASQLATALAASAGVLDLDNGDAEG